ncbi:hypothetical protein, partial [Neobacillus drentensis]|uniref:hypothetical protein n=1 Tax=Neobacillus drentensis TaxID=220684 RepID=UPI003001A124
MEINYIFRSKLVKRFSIENVFTNVTNEVSKTFNTISTFVPFPGTHPIKLLQNMIMAKNSQRDINHITGDVHYTALVLNPKTTILTIHDLVTLKNSKGIKRFILKMLWFDLPIRKSKLVTVISNQIANELSSLIPHAKPKIRIIYDPI